MPSAPSITTDSDIRNTSPDIDLRHLTDGVSVAGGTTSRKFSFTGSNILLTGTQNINATLPTVASMTFVGTATTQSLTNKTYIDALVTSSATTTIPLTVKGIASQTANLLEVQNSSATILTKIDSAGKIFAYNNITSPNISFTTTERFGEGATVTGNNALAVGYNTTSRINSIVIGNNSSTGTSTNNTTGGFVLIGKDTTLPSIAYSATVVGTGNTLTSSSNLVMVGTANSVNQSAHPSNHNIIFGRSNTSNVDSECVIVGASITNNSTPQGRCIALGESITAGSAGHFTGTISIGQNITNTGDGSLVIGPNSSSTGSTSAIVGRGTTTHDNCFLMGNDSRTAGISTASNQFLFSFYSTGGSAGYSQFYFGAGITSDTLGKRDAAGVVVPGYDFNAISSGGVTLYTTSAATTDINIQGLDMHIKPGYGSGLSKSGDFTIQVAGPAGVVSGNSLNSTYIERARFKSDGSTIFKPAGASYVPLTIMGAASQTADLQQWQNSSATILAKLTSTGIIQPAGYKSSDGTTAPLLTTTGGLTFKDGLYTSGTASSGSGLTWSGTASSITLVISNGYITTSGSSVTLTLPASVLGSTIRVVGHGAGGWVIDLTTNTQTVTYGSTSGTASLSSTNQHDCVELLCISSSEWKVISGVGTITIV